MRKLSIELTNQEFKKLVGLVKEWKEAEDLKEVSEIKGNFLDGINKLSVFTNQKGAFNIYDDEIIKIDF